MRVSLPATYIVPVRDCTVCGGYGQAFRMVPGKFPNQPRVPLLVTCWWCEGNRKEPREARA